MTSKGSIHIGELRHGPQNRLSLLAPQAGKPSSDRAGKLHVFSATAELLRRIQVMFDVSGDRWANHDRRFPSCRENEGCIMNNCDDLISGSLLALTVMGLALLCSSLLAFVFI
ncbi:hypothetical protein QA645_38760 [Bradyrhizobium sp. CIAT3101]|uniref:hypothetical protein n=1 Tax=Bradyrhizobium sp. CIAT3101 TaxID=439387 RepID=UPI0024B0A87F|nr:hypothetical protein [Bradyrhizobium sp. CIAT3101]WFU80377.1 hypothetical protein QA645_38760 [Bradyrhizobium sp. CIAT3101]